MLKSDYAGQHCSIAATLEIVGERWTLLILRDAFLGLRRFDEFQSSLGIARNVLSDRLAKLVAAGVLEKRRYSERPERFEYRLTRRGRDLRVALTALRQWGDEHLLEEPPRVLRRRSDGAPVVAALVPAGTDGVPEGDLEVVEGPGLRRIRA